MSMPLSSTSTQFSKELPYSPAVNALRWGVQMCFLPLGQTAEGKLSESDFPTVSALITHEKTSAQSDFGLGHVFIPLGWVDKEAEVMATILSPWERSMSNEVSRGNGVRKTENLGVGDVTWVPRLSWTQNSSLECYFIRWGLTWDWPQTWDPSASVFWVLGLQAWAKYQVWHRTFNDLFEQLNF